MGVLIGLAMLLLAVLLFSAVHSRFRYVGVFLTSIGAVFLVFSALLLLIGLVDWAWNQACKHLLKR